MEQSPSPSSIPSESLVFLCFLYYSMVLTTFGWFSLDFIRFFTGSRVYGWLATWLAGQREPRVRSEGIQGQSQQSQREVSQAKLLRISRILHKMS